MLVLVSKTYWGGMPFWFRRPPEHARHESVVLRAHDFRQLRALYWTGEQPPKVGVVLMHPRVDFHHHYMVPRLVGAGFAVLAANSRHVGNDLMCEHEALLLDVAACVRHLREKRGVQKVILIGNSGGGSLMAFYQAQAALAPTERLLQSPGGTPTFFDSAQMPPADALLLAAAHRGEGQVMLDAIDPSVVNEADPIATDRALDMYDASNGFAEPPAWSSYGAEFVARYTAAQRQRVARLDGVARAQLLQQAEAEQEAQDALSFAERQAIDRRRAREPIMVVYRTMASLRYVSGPSEREYGSLLSERPDLMNHAALGLGRTVTARAWLSTWSALSSNADLVRNAAKLTVPTLVVHAERDREIHLHTDTEPVFAAIAARDKRLVTIAGARHYFEPEPGEKDGPHVDRLMDAIVPWIEERFS